MSDRIVTVSDNGIAVDSIGDMDVVTLVEDSAVGTDAIFKYIVSRTEKTISDLGLGIDADPTIFVDLSLSDANIRVVEDISLLNRIKLTDEATGYDRVSVFKYKSVLLVRKLIPSRILHDHESRE